MRQEVKLENKERLNYEGSNSSYHLLKIYVLSNTVLSSLQGLHLILFNNLQK